MEIQVLKVKTEICLCSDDLHGEPLDRPGEILAKAHVSIGIHRPVVPANDEKTRSDWSQRPG